MAQITITATLQDVMGNALASTSFGGIFVQLCGYGSSIPRIAGTAVLAQTTPLEVQPATAGLVSFVLYGNDVITPSTTYYTVQAVDNNGNVIQTNAYLFTGNGPYDLSSAVVYSPDPTPINPPANAVYGSLTVIASTTTPALPASTAGLVTYDFTMTTNAVATMASATPGQAIILILRQDSVGNHIFTFPGNFDVNWTVPNPSPSSVSTQLGITDATGHVFPVGTASYN